MSSRVEPGQQSAWLDNGVADEDAFDDPAWEPLDDTAPVLGREEAARWLVKRGQRQEAARMRLSGSTQPRPPAPVVRVPERREPVAVPATRPRERRARRAGSSRDGPSSSESDLPPARPRLTAADRAALKKKVDARRREIVAASERAERSLEREWRRESAA
jgi:hypothetical protein